jgi:hypothetical protein
MHTALAWDLFNSHVGIKLRLVYSLENVFITVFYSFM